MRTVNSGSYKPIAVDQYTKDGELVNSFPSLCQAEREGFIQNKISRCLHGHNHTHKGFIWRRKGEQFNQVKQIIKFR